MLLFFQIIEVEKWEDTIIKKKTTAHHPTTQRYTFPYVYIPAYVMLFDAL